MYTLLEEPDGSVLLRTHVPPTEMPSGAARRLLLALEPTLARLRERAGGEASPSPPPVSHPDPGRADAGDSASAETTDREG